MAWVISHCKTGTPKCWLPSCAMPGITLEKAMPTASAGSSLLAVGALFLRAPSTAASHATSASHAAAAPETLETLARGEVDGVHQCVGTLGGFDGFRDRHFAAPVDAV